MVSFRDSLAEGIRQATCTWAMNVDNFWTSTGNLVAGATGLPNWITTDPSAGLVSRIVCDMDDPIPLPPEPFTGGQCDGILYNCSTTITQTFDDGREFIFPVSGTLVGPISFQQEAQRGGDNVFTGFVGGDGQELGVTGTSVASYSASGTSVSRVDGQADDCGNPPIITNPTNINNNVTNNITYVNNEGNTVNQDINYSFGFAYVDVNLEAEFNIPVNVDVGGVNIPVRFNLSTGDIVFQFGGRGGGPGGGGGDRIVLEPAPPELPPDTGPDIPEPPDPRTEEQIIGAMVTVTALNNQFFGTEVNGGDASNLFLPRLGQVQFTYRFSDGSVAYSEAFGVTNRRQFVPSPRPENTIDATLFPANGVSLFLSLVKDLVQINSQEVN